LRPRDLGVTLTVLAASRAAFLVTLNGASAFRIEVAAGQSDVVLRVPAPLLFRGDNLLTLSAVDGVHPGVRLLSYRLRAAS
jgi:hypothetical protein